jgi:response regulator RpfG family c-di-GMP phosphodiesterase
MNFSLNEPPRVLLIDRNSLKRQVRASVLRSYEVEVHTADNIADAGCLWTRCSYDLVLFAAQEHSEEAVLLCGELRKSKPKQRIALLVGAPQYVREVGRQRKEPQPPALACTPKVEIGATPACPTQWQGTVNRLLAAG